SGGGRGTGVAGGGGRQAGGGGDGYAAAEAAWAEVEGALRLFTPQGALNTPAQARAVIDAALPRLSGPAWAKVRRQVQRPQLLAFLDEASTGLSRLPVAAEVLAAAVRVEGLRRQPEALRGAGPGAAALRGVLLAPKGSSSFSCNLP